MYIGESTENDWDVYWSKREVSGLKSWFPRLQQFLLRKLVDKHFINTALVYSRPGRIVEVGSGIGLDSILLSKKRGDSVLLIDFSKKVLREARRTAKEFDTRIDTLEYDIREKLPLKDKSAALAWNVGTIEHFEDPVKIVKEMRRISECVICIVPMGSPRRQTYEKIRNFLGLGANGLFILYTPHELKQIFKKAGFSNVRIEEYIFFGGFISFCGAIGID